MLDLHTTVYSALNEIGIPTHYEHTLHSGLAVPCISYMLLTDTIDAQTDVTDVCRISFQVKVWAEKLSDLQTYSLLVDAKMRSLNFKRTSAAELYDVNSTMKQKVMVYECVAIDN